MTTINNRDELTVTNIKPEQLIKMLEDMNYDVTAILKASDEKIVNAFKNRVLENATLTKQAWAEGRNEYARKSADLILAERYDYYGADVEELKRFVCEAYA